MMTARDLLEISVCVGVVAASGFGRCPVLSVWRSEASAWKDPIGDQQHLLPEK
jgi:hypothetical protein